MANGFLLHSLPFATAAFSTPAAGTAASHVANDFMGMVMRSAAAANPAAVRLDMGSAQLLDSVALLECFCRNSSNGVTVSIGNDATFASYVEQIDITPPASEYRARSGLQHALGFFTTTTPCRYALVQVNGDGVFLPQFARALIGRRYQPAYNFSFGAGRGVEDMGDLEHAARGATLRRRARKLRTLGLSWQFIRQTEAEAFALPLLEAVGNTEYLLACLNPDADVERSRRMYFGNIKGDLGLTWRAHNLFEKRLQMQSVI